VLARAALLAAASACAAGARAEAAPLLRSAEVRVTIISPLVCEVLMTLAVDDAAAEIDHRIEAFDGSRIDLVGLRGAGTVGERRTIGRTRSLVLRPLARTYTIEYRVSQPAARRHRCPLWVPVVPADGVSRAVSIEIDMPSGTRVSASMPVFSWTESRGVATMGHLPAFVRIPYHAEGQEPPWEMARAMDLAALAFVVGATGLWAWRRRRRGGEERRAPV
jgi:hypothetical protein